MNDQSPNLDMGEEQEDEDQSFENKVFFFFTKYIFTLFNGCKISFIASRDFS